VLVVDVALVRRFTVDDAYITLRYSQNVARGIGAVYNAIGPRAEGYTSYLWMALLAIPHLIHADALFAAKTMGVLFTFATALLVAGWTFTEAGGTRRRVIAASAAMFAYCVLPRTAVHAVSGMETAFYTTVLTGMLFAVSRLVRDGVSWAAPFAAFAFVAALTRPEACLAAGVATAVALAMLPPAARRPVVVRIASIFAAPLCAYEVFRLRYYGLPFPLPFYVKVASPGALPGAEPVATWLAGELRFMAPLLFLLRAPPRHFRPVLAACAVLVLFFLLPQHLMGYASRYLSPLDPVMSVLFGLGVGKLVIGDEGDESPAPSSGRVVKAIVVAVSLGVPLAMLAREAPGEFEERLAYADGLAAAHERLGRELEALHLRNGRLALSDAGAVPYLSGWWTLDLIGLNDAHIAVTGSRDPARVLATAPDLLVLVSTDARRFVPYDWNAFEGPLFDAATFAGYTRVGLRRFADDYWLWLLARPSGEAGKRLTLDEGLESGRDERRSE